MATLTLVATISANGAVTVTRGTGGALGGGIATLLIDNTKSNAEVSKAMEAIERAYSREFSRKGKVASLATSGSSVE